MVLLVMTITMTYMWLRIPTLSRYSLQAFCVAILVFFIVKRSQNAKLWHIMPTPLSAETVAVTFAFLLLIGETGNLSSQFFALGYIHLFFIAMASHTFTAIVVTIAAMVFHYLLSGQMGGQEFSNLLSLPIMTTFYVFSKKQYDEIQAEKEVIEDEESKISNLKQEKHTLRKMLAEYVEPYIEYIYSSIQSNTLNGQQLLGQLETILFEIRKITTNQSPADTAETKQTKQTEHEK